MTPPALAFFPRPFRLGGYFIILTVATTLNAHGVKDIQTNPKVMGQFTLPRGLRLMGWLATAVMIACRLGLLATLGQ